MPKRVREEVDSSRHYYYDKERCIFCDMIRQELDSKSRVIGENDHFVTLGPVRARGFLLKCGFFRRQHSSAFENNQTPMYCGPFAHAEG